MGLPTKESFIDPSDPEHIISIKRIDKVLYYADFSVKYVDNFSKFLSERCKGNGMNDLSTLLAINNLITFQDVYEYIESIKIVGEYKLFDVDFYLKYKPYFNRLHDEIKHRSRSIKSKYASKLRKLRTIIDSFNEKLNIVNKFIEYVE